ncbi:MAG: TrmH family RNA methyltransferase, partial [Bacteroidota bacterium]|nr:TrmH family RNA methyltransferase [Bacteroidota bacterium]
TELEGISETALKLADGFVRIPMYGFTESYNISVSAALCMFSMRESLESKGIAWQLTEDEILDLKLDWAKKSVKTPELHEEHFVKAYLQNISDPASYRF